MLVFPSPAVKQIALGTEFLGDLRDRFAEYHKLEGLGFEFCSDPNKLDKSPGNNRLEIAA